MYFVYKILNNLLNIALYAIKAAKNFKPPKIAF